MANYLINEVVDKAIKMNADTSRSALSMLYPNDFEYYMLSLELVGTGADGKDFLIRYFTFPVNPTSIQQQNTKITSVKKTFGGVSIVSSDEFIPKDITIQGNFGRNFKIILNNSSNSSETFNSIGLVGGKKTDVFSKKKDPKNLLSKPATPLLNELSPFIKTGFGSIKLLEAICEQADDTDNGFPRKLFLHNPALGHSYLVKVVNLNLSQNQSQNMIWGYTLTLKAICDTINIRGVDDKSLQNSLMQGMVQKRVNQSVASAQRTTEQINRNVKSLGNWVVNDIRQIGIG